MVYSYVSIFDFIDSKAMNHTLRTAVYLKCIIILSGIVYLWSILAGVSLLYVANDIAGTPESTVLKLDFILLTAFIGLLELLFMYWAAAIRCPACMSAVRHCAGDRIWALRCIVWPVRAWEFSLVHSWGDGWRLACRARLPSSMY